MIDARAATLEFSCRMGDPEANPSQCAWRPLVEVLGAAVDGRLDQIELQWDRRTALGVVMAAHGYYDNPRKDDAITSLPRTGRRHGVHAGTQLGDDGVVRTSGGRVLSVTALAWRG